MVFEHDYEKFPELSNKQIEEFGFTSPHIQITDDFDATVLRVVDGDTISITSTLRDFSFPLRFLDIDAPEMSEGGETAKAWLKERIEKQNVRILINFRNRVDKVGRLLGSVIHGGSDVGEEELRLGLAVEFKNRREADIPALETTFALKQWFE